MEFEEPVLTESDVGETDLPLNFTLDIPDSRLVPPPRFVDNEPQPRFDFTGIKNRTVSMFREDVEDREEEKVEKGCDFELIPTMFYVKDKKELYRISNFDNVEEKTESEFLIDVEGVKNEFLEFLKPESRLRQLLKSGEKTMTLEMCEPPLNQYENFVLIWLLIEFAGADIKLQRGYLHETDEGRQKCTTPVVVHYPSKRCYCTVSDDTERRSKIFNVTKDYVLFHMFVEDMGEGQAPPVFRSRLLYQCKKGQAVMIPKMYNYVFNESPPTFSNPVASLIKGVPKVHFRDPSNVYWRIRQQDGWGFGPGTHTLTKQLRYGERKTEDVVSYVNLNRLRDLSRFQEKIYDFVRVAKCDENIIFWGEHKIGYGNIINFPHAKVFSRLMKDKTYNVVIDEDEAPNFLKMFNYEKGSWSEKTNALFPREFESYVLHLMWCNEQDGVPFGTISYDVLLYKIIPFIDEWDVWLSATEQRRRYYLPRFYVHNIRCLRAIDMLRVEKSQFVVNSDSDSNSDDFTIAKCFVAVNYYRAYFFTAFDFRGGSLSNMYHHAFLYEVNADDARCEKMVEEALKLVDHVFQMDLQLVNEEECESKGKEKGGEEKETQETKLVRRLLVVCTQIIDGVLYFILRGGLRNPSFLQNNLPLMKKILRKMTDYYPKNLDDVPEEKRYHYHVDPTREGDVEFHVNRIINSAMRLEATFRYLDFLPDELFGAIESNTDYCLFLYVFSRSHSHPRLIRHYLSCPTFKQKLWQLLSTFKSWTLYEQKSERETIANLFSFALLIFRIEREENGDEGAAKFLNNLAPCYFFEGCFPRLGMDYTILSEDNNAFIGAMVNSEEFLDWVEVLAEHLDQEKLAVIAPCIFMAFWAFRVVDHNMQRYFWRKFSRAVFLTLSKCFSKIPDILLATPSYARGFDQPSEEDHKYFVTYRGCLLTLIMTKHISSCLSIADSTKHGGMSPFTEDPATLKCLLSSIVLILRRKCLYNDRLGLGKQYCMVSLLKCFEINSVNIARNHALREVFVGAFEVWSILQSYHDEMLQFKSMPYVKTINESQILQLVAKDMNEVKTFCEARYHHTAGPEDGDCDDDEEETSSLLQEWIIRFNNSPCFGDLCVRACTVLEYLSSLYHFSRRNKEWENVNFEVKVCNLHEFFDFVHRSKRTSVQKQGVYYGYYAKEGKKSSDLEFIFPTSEKSIWVNLYEISCSIASIFGILSNLSEEIATRVMKSRKTQTVLLHFLEVLIRSGSHINRRGVCKLLLKTVDLLQFAGVNQWWSISNFVMRELLSYSSSTEKVSEQEKRRFLRLLNWGLPRDDCYDFNEFMFNYIVRDASVLHFNRSNWQLKKHQSLRSIFQFLLRCIDQKDSTTLLREPALAVIRSSHYKLAEIYFFETPGIVVTEWDTSVITNVCSKPDSYLCFIRALLGTFMEKFHKGLPLRRRCKFNEHAIKVLELFFLRNNRCITGVFEFLFEILKFIEVKQVREIHYSVWHGLFDLFGEIPRLIEAYHLQRKKAIQKNESSIVLVTESDKDGANNNSLFPIEEFNFENTETENESEFPSVLNFPKVEEEEKKRKLDDAEKKEKEEKPPELTQEEYEQAKLLFVEYTRRMNVESSYERWDNLWAQLSLLEDNEWLRGLNEIVVKKLKESIEIQSKLSDAPRLTAMRMYLSRFEWKTTTSQSLSVENDSSAIVPSHEGSKKAAVGGGGGGGGKGSEFNLSFDFEFGNDQTAMGIFQSESPPHSHQQQQEEEEGGIDSSSATPSLPNAVGNMMNFELPSNKSEIPEIPDFVDLGLDGSRSEETVLFAFENDQENGEESSTSTARNNTDLPPMQMQRGRRNKRKKKKKKIVSDPLSNKNKDKNLLFETDIGFKGMYYFDDDSASGSSSKGNETKQKKDDDDDEKNVDFVFDSGDVFKFD